MTDPFVYIVVLTWNNSKDTLECISSLSGIDYPRHQILLVDNGSIDDTVTSVRQHFPLVQIIENKENLGYAEGNNIGIQAALSNGAEYILLLNNDTVVDKKVLTNLVDVMNQDSDIGIASPYIYWHSNPHILWFSGAKWKADSANFMPIMPEEDTNIKKMPYHETDYACGCALFIRSSIIPKLGLFDPRYFLVWEETDFCYRARRKRYKVLMIPSSKVWHKVSKSFSEGGQGAHYQYYFTRNRLLWIENNLMGTEKYVAFSRCIREIYWQIREMDREKIRFQESFVLRAKLLGVLHYILRKFGPGPSFG